MCLNTFLKIIQCFQAFNNFPFLLLLTIFQLLTFTIFQVSLHLVFLVHATATPKPHNHGYSCVAFSHKQDIVEKMEHDFIQLGRCIYNQVEEELRTHIYSIRYKTNSNKLTEEEKKYIILTFTNKNYTLLKNKNKPSITGN